ncbi:MAG: DUF1015 domain-containing protein [Phycisphaerales bacterium]|nr:MAG: DUF1015 domain-containing protein [Phycisphaerales bacterium]
MCEIRPFAALRYDFARTKGDLSTLLAPPYDVLGQSDKDALLRRSDKNIVSIDLPHIPPKSAGPAEVYEHAAEELGKWVDEGTLLRESQPAIYLYHQRFEHGGRPYIRRMFIARVRLQPFSEGTIMPHERTFGGPKEDRLALMKTTGCQLSPIFALYTDPEDKVGVAFAGTAAVPPDATGRLDGVENRVWIVTDQGLCNQVAGLLADKKLYIADGHHRYTTALNYRDWVTAEQGGSLSEDPPANFCMFVLASMDDPGCLILPYNRALAEVELQTVLDAWSPGTEEVTADKADIVLWDGPTGQEAPLRFTDRDKLAALEPDQPVPWYKLDYAYLHRYLIDELLSAKLGVEPQVRYVKSAENAKQAAREESGVALLVNATPMAHMRAVSEAGGLMPQKSTYFHPKLATGLTINPLK